MSPGRVAPARPRKSTQIAFIYVGGFGLLEAVNSAISFSLAHETLDSRHQSMPPSPRRSSRLKRNNDLFPRVGTWTDPVYVLFFCCVRRVAPSHLPKSSLPSFESSSSMGGINTSSFYRQNYFITPKTAVLTWPLSGSHGCSLSPHQAAGVYRING